MYGKLGRRECLQKASVTAGETGCRFWAGREYKSENLGLPIIINSVSKMPSFFDRFRRTKNANGKFKKPYYSIQSVHAEGKVLDVAQDGDHKGSLILWDGYGGQNQQFTIKQKGPFYYLKSKKDKRYLTVEGPHDGARVYASDKLKSDNQKFTLDKRGDHEYVIYTFFGKCLDVHEGSKKNGATIVQWSENGGKNQLWTLTDPKNITSSSSELEE